MLTYMKRGGNFYRRVFLLAAPLMLQNLITSTLAMADTFMVGLLGEVHMAAVTLANIPIFVLQLFLFGVQSGITILISQYWGKGDYDAINRVTGVAFWVVNAVSIAFALLLLFYPIPFFGLFGNDPSVVELAASYGKIIGFSYVLNGMTLVYTALWRSIERPRIGMYILILSMVTNTFLNWVLIFGTLGAPSLGVQGAAIATLCARGLEFLIVVIHMLRAKDFPFQYRTMLLPGLDMVKRCLRYGSPVVWNETLWGLGTATLQTILGHMEHSKEILAAYTIAGNVEKLCLVTAFGISTTASIIIGREIGAGRSHLVYEVGLALNTLAAGIGFLLGLLLLGFTHWIAPIWFFPLFQLSPQAVSVATMMLTVQVALMPIRNFNYCNIVGVLRGGGDVQMATIIDLVPLWLVSIPVSALVGLVWKLGITLVYLSMGLENIVKFFMGIFRLRSGKWVHDLTQKEP